MTHRFFRLTPIKFSALGKWVLLVALLAATGSATSRAQTPEPTPTPTPATNKPKLAYLRLWNMLPSTPPTTLELLSADKPLVTGAVCNFYAGYASVAPGAFTLTVRRAGDQNGAIKRLPVNLLADMFVTVLVSSKDGQPNVELINDTVDPKAAVTKRLVLRQLFPNAKVTTVVGNAAPSAPLTFGETAVLDNLPEASSSLTVQAAIPGQSVKSWSMPLELPPNARATLLIFPDSYGRFRPRLAMDGQASGESGHEGERH